MNLKTRICYILFALCWAGWLPQAKAQSFEQEQLRYPRVREAKSFADSPLRADLEAKGFTQAPVEVYLRAFKAEAFLEVWIRKSASSPFVLFKKYPICALSGELGPKSQQGDRQVPEGMYHINRFNPSSNFYLSLKVSYPNNADRKRSTASALGGDIYIHGSCVSIGCLAMTDPTIKELYWLLVLTKSQAEKRIPCHIFPARFTKTKYEILRLIYREEPKNLQLWEQMFKVYNHFEQNHTLPRINIHADGHYLVDAE